MTETEHTSARFAAALNGSAEARRFFTEKIRCMSVFFTADSCDSLGLCIPDGMLRVFFENSFILRVRSRARPKLKLRAWSTGEGCFNNRSQRPQPCDLHGEDLERERSAKMN